MFDEWRDITSAPKHEAVLICTRNCQVCVAIQEEMDTYDQKTQKPIKEWTWVGVEYLSQSRPRYKAAAWMPTPLPPKHLYERKLTADLLAKQVKELRGES